MVTTGKESAVQKAAEKKGPARFSQNGKIGILLKQKLTDPKTAHLKPKQLYDLLSESEKDFWESGIDLSKF